MIGGTSRPRSQEKRFDLSVGERHGSQDSADLLHVCVCVLRQASEGDSEGSQLGHDLLLRLGESLFRNIWLQRLKHENIHYSTNLEQEKDTKRTTSRGALSSVAIVE